MEDFGGLPTMVGAMERDLSGFTAAPREGEVLAPGPNHALMMQTSREITARKVAVPRHVPHILREIREMCAAFGDTYVYSWEVKNRQKGTTETIKGPTIKMAMMLVQAFGNCSVDMDIQETATHWVFKSWFMDYEKGTSLSRLFQQRKSQNTGMRDADRAADIVFQIGQSKAARNVVVNALSSFTSYALEEAEKGLLSKFNSPEAIDKAWSFMDHVMEQHDIDISRVEAVIGRRRKDFTIPNLAKAYMMLRGIAEGLATADDQFPTEEAAAEINADREAERTETKKREGRGKKAEPAAPKAEPQPNPADPAEQERKHEQARERQQEQKAAEKPRGFDDEAAGEIIAAYGTAQDFETIQRLRGEAAQIGLKDHAGVSDAYEAAMKRVKAANAAKAAAAPQQTQQSQQATSGQTDAPTEDVNSGGEPDEEDVIGRIEQMFDGLDVTADIEAVREKIMPAAETLSKDGYARVTGFYNAAQERARVKALPKAADDPKPAPKAAPSARAALFSEND